jgi:glutamyl-tRNA reductase
VDPEVDRIRNVFRFDIDTLKGVVDQSVARRRKEVPAVERLVQDEVAGFMRWWDGLASGPVIRDLNQVFETVRAHEVEKNSKRFRDEDREQLDIFSRNLVRKFLMTATVQMKHLKDGDPVARERLSAVRHIFGLDARGGEDEDEDSR